LQQIGSVPGVTVTNFSDTGEFMSNQKQRVFFGPHDPWGESKPTDEERKAIISRDNPDSPFFRFVGNDKAIRKLQTAAFSALGHENHLMRDLSFAIFGPASAGKTTVARLYAEVVQLPFVEVSPKQIKTLEDLYREINRVLTDQGVPLVEYKPKHYALPPVVILIDEVHALSDSVIQGLLKATEYNDAVMATETGKIINTHDATWFIATTDEGKLFDAFRTRFSPIVLKMLNKSDVAKVVKLANPDLSDDVCHLVAHYNSRIPRKALEFARYMRMVRDMTPNESWEEIAAQVASDEGIDVYGMHEVHLTILKSLGQGPVARNRISLIAGRKEEEVEKFIMPWLLTETDDQPALVTVTTKGYTITEAGLAELDRRGINHLGQRAVPKGFND
jgi:Holliday junction resolvasome RuvABC ATP-dependent DNA helicase subunit